MNSPAINKTGPVTGVVHHGITVEDVDRALWLYRDLLGLELVVDRTTSDRYLGDIHGVPFREVRMAFVRIPGTGETIELVQYEGVAAEPTRSVPWNPGMGHICLSVEDIDAVDGAIRKAGFVPLSAKPVEISSGPNKGAKVVKFRDGDGYWVELWQPSPIDSQEG
jgi:lactoylglutathione lyase